MTLRQALRERASRSYPLAKLDAHWTLRRSLAGHANPVIVCQMGKVGSTAVSQAIREGTPRKVLRIHAANPKILVSSEQNYRRMWPVEGGAGHLWKGQHVQRLLRRQPDATWDVVTMVRDPVARNVSEFFQSAWLGYLDYESLSERLDDPALLDELLDGFLHRFDRHDVAFDWFQLHMEEPFGVDIYDEPFPRERGWHIVEAGRAKVLILRYEDLRAIGAEALGALLETDPVPLPDANVSADKVYGSLYRRFRAEAALPDEYLERMYGSRLAEHFYTDAEREAMALAWRAGRHAAS